MVNANVYHVLNRCHALGKTVNHVAEVNQCMIDFHHYIQCKEEPSETILQLEDFSTYYVISLVAYDVNVAVNKSGLIFHNQIHLPSRSATMYLDQRRNHSKSIDNTISQVLEVASKMATRCIPDIETIDINDRTRM